MTVNDQWREFHFRLQWFWQVRGFYMRNDLAGFPEGAD